ncbi:MAG: aldolase [Lentisphaerae bacterium]|nr:aldolase [Lentisphaerota bacterium]
MIDLTLKNKLKSPEIIFGTHTGLNNAVIAGIMSGIGYDYLWIDTEHAAVDYAELVQMIGNAWHAGTPPLVRVTIGDRNHTKKVVEMGPAGVIFPMINTAEQAYEAIKHTLYPPDGIRGVGPQQAVRYGIDSELEYLQCANKAMCRFIQLESPESIDNLPEMLKNPWIDGFIVGPMDLSCLAGCPGDIYGEKVTGLLRKAADLILPAGRRFGLSLGGELTAEKIKHFLDLGINMISTGNDYSFVLQGARKNLEMLRSGK